MIRGLLQTSKCIQSTRHFTPSVQCFGSAEFDGAQMKLKTLKEEPDNDIKLKLYALFKQATSGDVQGKRPGMMDFVGRAKFDAWNNLKGTSRENAESDYIKLVRSLLAEDQQNASAAPSATIDGLKPVDGLDVSREGRVFKIRLNRPTKFNALTYDMYIGIINALEASNKDTSTSMTVFTGTGPYYCSGNDLTNFKEAFGASKEKMVELSNKSGSMFKDFVDAFINHEKPLIGLVNGPAVGISVTVLGMFDYVVASDKATFHTPFAMLGQSPEGCSSYTFPLIMGATRASEMLLMCKKITSHVAANYGLINEVVPHAEFESQSEKCLAEFSKFPPETFRINKMLLRSLHKEQLLKTNAKEVDQLVERWLSKECHQAIANFMSRSKK